MSTRRWRPLAGSVALAAAACASAPAPAPPVTEPCSEAPAPSEHAEAPTKPRVAVVLYLMAKDPFKSPLEITLAKIASEWPELVSIEPRFIGTAKNGTMSALHGPDELAADLAQVCAYRYVDRWLDVAICQNGESTKMAGSWPGCAEKAGVAKAKVEEVMVCANGDEGRELLLRDFERSEAEHVRASPTLLIAGAEYQGTRDKRDIQRHICNAIPDPRPAECATIPPADPVDAIVLFDKRCPTCEKPTAIASGIKSAFEGADTKEVEIGTPAGASLFASIQPARLPVVVFDPPLADGVTAKYKDRLEKRNEETILPRGKWDPVCADATACSLDACKAAIACQKEAPKTLDVFVSPHSPMAMRVLRSVDEVRAAVDRRHEHLDFRFHYLPADPAGPPSVSSLDKDEELRGVCVIAHTPKNDAVAGYVICRQKDPRADFADCAGPASGIRADDVKKCIASGEGDKLLESALQAAVASDVAADGVVLVNGIDPVMVRDSSMLLAAICKRNKLAACSEKLWAL